MKNTTKSAAAGSLVGAATRAGEFTQFLNAASAAGLTDRLRSEGPFTLMAPTDDAFEQVSPDALATLLAPNNRQRLRDVLNYHLAAGAVRASRFAGKVIRARTMAGGDLRIDGRNGLTVNGANVVLPDIVAANGVLHGIDRLLFPKLAPADA